MRDPTRPEVINSVNQGVRNAQEDYKKAYMSHICSSYAPEYLMTVYIFQSILELKEKCGCTYGLSLEEPVYELAKSLGARPRYPKDARIYGYCDLLLRDINDKPRAALEVKKYAWDYPADLGRLAYLVEKGLEFGVFVSCWFEEVIDNNHKEVEERLKEEMQCIRDHIKEDIRGRHNELLVQAELGNIERLVLEGETSGQEEYRWCPVCFMIYHKKSQW